MISKKKKKKTSTVIIANYDVLLSNNPSLGLHLKILSFNQFIWNAICKHTTLRAVLRPLNRKKKSSGRTLDSKPQNTWKRSKISKLIPYVWQDDLFCSLTPPWLDLWTFYSITVDFTVCSYVTCIFSYSIIQTFENSNLIIHSKYVTRNVTQYKKMFIWLCYCRVIVVSTVYH